MEAGRTDFQSCRGSRKSRIVQWMGGQERGSLKGALQSEDWTRRGIPAEMLELVEWEAGEKEERCLVKPFRCERR